MHANNIPAQNTELFSYLFNCRNVAKEVELVYIGGSPMEEAREFKRVKVSFTVLYRVDAPLSIRMYIGKKEFDAVALDLSEGGMAILTKYKNYAIPAFTIVKVKFAMQKNVAVAEGGYKSIEVKGEVRSSFFMKEKDAYRLGIRFIDMSDEERKFIRKFG